MDNGRPYAGGLLTGSWSWAVLFICLVATECVAVNDVEHRPIRALFDEDYNWISVNGADRLVDQAKRGGFTVIVPCVWHGRGTAWESSLAPLDDRLDSRVIGDRDPLKYLIDRAAANGIEVHPWFTVFLRQRELWPEFTDGWNSEMFDIHNDGYTSRIAALVEEVVARYPINGINLDYVRAIEVCRSIKCQERYLKDRGRSLLADITLSSVNDTARKSIVAWQTGAVARAVARISSIARSKRDILISADTIVGADGWDLKGADGIGWLNAGFVDLVFHMDYRARPDLARLSMARHGAVQPRSVLLLVANYQQELDMGLKSPPRKGKQLVEVINQSQGDVGQALEYGVYEYRFLTLEQLSALGELLKSGVDASQ